MIEKTNWFKNQSIYQYIRQQSENRKVMQYLEIGGTFALITIFLITAIAPTASAISKLFGDIKSKEATTIAMKQKIANIVLAQDDFARAQEKFSILESSYPSNPEFYQAASTFSSISRQSNTSIKQIRYNLSNVSKKENIQSYDVDLSVSGSYSSMLDMIKKVENGRRLIDINSVAFTQTDKGLTLNLSTNLVYSSISSNE